MLSQFFPGKTVRPPHDFLGLSARSLKYLGLITGLTGAVMILGWILAIPILTSEFPGFFAIKINAAVSLFLAGSSLWLLQEQGSSWRLKSARALAVALTALGALTLIEYPTGWDFGIDQLLYQDTAKGHQGTLGHPGRMTPDTALAFTLLGLALLLLRPSKKGAGVVGLLIVVIGLNRVIAMTAAPDGLRNFVGIAIPTTVPDRHPA